MSARKKLNGASVTGTVLIAGLVGYITHSPVIFFVALGALLTADIIGGNIRGGRGR